MELEKRIKKLKKELDTRNWEWERDENKLEIQEKLEFLEKIYNSLYSLI